MPLRLFNVREWLSGNTLVFKPASDWNFCIVSHTWGTFPAWTFVCDLSGKNMEVSAFRKTDLTTAAKCIYKVGYEWCWIDNICIDQNSIEEKQREITSMGLYYRSAMKCLVFTGGLHNVGEIVYNNYTVPRWHNRVWTLQEAVLSKDAAYVYRVDNISNLTTPTRLNKMRERQIKISCSWADDGKHYLIIDKDNVYDAVSSMLDIIYEKTKLPLSVNKGKVLRSTLTSLKTDHWDLLNAIRESGGRDTSKDEDVVYGILGLLNITNIEIEYGIGKHNASLKLAEALPKSYIPMLMMCDFTYNAIPDFSVDSRRYAAWGLDVDACTANATIFDDRMHVTTMCSRVSLERKGIGSTVRAGGANGGERPSWPLEPIEATKNNSIVSACFGVMLKLANNTKADYDLLLIGENNKDWAKNALSANKAAICVAVKSCVNGIKYKRGIVVVDMDKVIWTKETHAVHIGA
jgi:hypothetical protein